MNPRVKEALLDQIQQQSQFVLWANDALQAKLRSDDTGPAEVFFVIHGLLAAAGNISKALWGVLRDGKPRYAADRRPVRDQLQVTDVSPLYPPLEVRNGFEHYDERVTEFIESNPDTAVIDTNIGPPGFISPPRPMLRHYDPATGMVSFVGTTFNIPAVVSEVKRILPLATEALGARR